jgi:hypothetical protein
LTFAVLQVREDAIPNGLKAQTTNVGTGERLRLQTFSENEMKSIKEDIHSSKTGHGSSLSLLSILEQKGQNKNNAVGST